MRLNPREVPIELEETVASFNGMLERIEMGFRTWKFLRLISPIECGRLLPIATQTEVAVGQNAFCR